MITRTSFNNRVLAGVYITRYVHTTSRQMWWAYRHSRSSSSWQGEILPTAAAALAFAEVENWGRK